MGLSSMESNFNELRFHERRVVYRGKTVPELSNVFVNVGYIFVSVKRMCLSVDDSAMSDEGIYYGGLIRMILGN